MVAYVYGLGSTRILIHIHECNNPNWSYYIIGVEDLVGGSILYELCFCFGFMSNVVLDTQLTTKNTI